MRDPFFNSLGVTTSMRKSQELEGGVQRCEKGKAQAVVESPSELEKRISDFSQKRIVLEKILREFKDVDKGPMEISPELRMRLSICSQQNIILKAILRKFIGTEKGLRMGNGDVSMSAGGDGLKQIQTRLQTLKEEREKLLGLKVSAEGKSREYLIPCPPNWRENGDQIQAHMEALKEERDELEECKDMEEGRSKEYLDIGNALSRHVAPSDSFPTRGTILGWGPGISKLPRAVA
ncbi:corticosteroid 11-beta-dehydrogenase isozyme 1-like [Platysternon megacephalum]|uniref:Corticosteroid 11-beta-dehydrogenase isozyme 1-like n=1 Tax=Platysternon megacephalum TaxID=55544 RepID=A0A4D9DID4_9SAUR|nr:corticosteroid 11-beta-dehydrogenase isozyme 1-like [Platysternon megacephalum]